MKATHEITLRASDDSPSHWTVVNNFGDAIVKIQRESNTIVRVEKLPDPIGPGDIVTWRGEIAYYKVLAVVRAKAWLRSWNGPVENDRIVGVDILRRIAP